MILLAANTYAWQMAIATFIIVVLFAAGVWLIRKMKDWVA
jgi:hypothetical protein